MFAENNRPVPAANGIARALASLSAAKKLIGEFLKPGSHHTCGYFIVSDIGKAQ